MKHTKVDMGRFELGETEATPAAMELLGVAGADPRELIFKHRTGDFGDWPDDDLNEELTRENDRAVEHGGGIASCFPVADEFHPDASEEFVVVVTAADRSRTTVMALGEYPVAA